MPIQLSRAAVLRVLRSVLLAELQASTRRALTSAEAARWPDDLSFGPDGLALDSLELLACATAANQLFHMHEVGIEDYLVMERRLDRWTDIVLAALQEGTSGITFATSGSTGAPKPCRHAAADLLAEAAHWAGHWTMQAIPRRRIIQMVPAHHIYGFLFTVLLPERLGIPVLDGRVLAPGVLRAQLSGDDLLVGHPTGLAQLVRALPAFPAGLHVVSSTAPLPAALHEQLRAHGAGDITEVYGSSETGGIAARHSPEASFVLLPRWREGGAGDAASVVAAATGIAHPLPDRVAWLGERALVLHGRRDDAVQVGGVNVFPARIAAQLRQHPMVADCAVRLDTALTEPRLKALVVPVAAGLAADAPLGALLEQWCREQFTPAERPVRIDLADRLPRSDLGKQADWASADATTA